MQRAALSHEFASEKREIIRNAGMGKAGIFYRILLSLLLFLVITSVSLPAGDRAEEGGRNVLLITIDTLRADRLSCYSREHVPTPNIDGLAETGALFSRAFANTSTTLPSHTNILLGVSPLYHGVHDNLNFVVREDFLTLAEHLKASGYSTAAYVGAYPLDARFGLDQGFDIYDADYPHDYYADLTALERRAEEVVSKACEGIKDAKRPWFIWVHCYDPHLPYEPPEPFRSRFAENPYDGEVAYVDLVMGKLLDCLKDERLYDDAVIVLTGDHGESLGQHGELSHGFFAYNSAIWVPFIMKAPGIEPASFSQYVSHLDIFPTICDLIGVKKPAFLQGDSLVPLMKGNRISDRTIYFESMYPFYSHGWAPLMGFIQGNEKFIESPIPELYDLEQDFDELANLAERTKLDRYREQLEKTIRDQSSTANIRAKERADSETLEKLRSLGYISSSSGSKKSVFGPEDDIKTLLPVHTKNFEAMGLHKKGKTEEAKAILQNVLKENRNVGMTYVYLGSVIADEGRLEESLELLREGLSKFPDMYEIYKQYVKTLRRARNFDEIIDNFNEKSFREIPVDPEIWNHVGFAYAVKEDWDKAIQAFERAISLDPRYAEAYFNRGEAYLSKAQKIRDQNMAMMASENFKKAIEMDPDYAPAYFSLGRFYRQAGNVEGAIYCWEKAVELQPDFGLAQFYLGEAYLEKGDKEKALERFLYLKEKFFQRFPDDLKNKIEAYIEQCKKK
jgi:arylsulfatase A-like enzyme/Flp pilus assembly protein TadD